MFKGLHRSGLVVLLVGLCFLPFTSPSHAVDFPSSASPLYDHEDQLLQRFYSDFGKGRYVHNPRRPDRRSGLLIKTKAVLRNAFTLLRETSEFKATYKEVFLPIVLKNHPQLLTNPKYKKFYKKLVDEAGKNWFFSTLTADLHNSTVPDLANLFFGVAHPVYDVLFDDAAIANWKNKNNINRIERIIKKDYRIPYPNPTETLLIEIVKGLDRSVPQQNKELFFYYLLKLHHAQVDSIWQHNNRISNAFLRRTTFRKGGYSMVLYALLADHVFSKKELDVYFLLGAMLQSLDDFNDIIEDQSQGISSLAGRALISPEEEWAMRDLLYQQLLKLKNNQSYNTRKVNRYINALDLFLYSSESAYSRHLRQ